VMFKVFAISAIVATAAAVDPLAVMQCQSKYASNAGTPCEALNALSKCFTNAGIDSLEASDPIRQLAVNFLSGQEAKSNCAEAEGEPVNIRTARGDMQFEVSKSDDVKIYRYRRETVSLFDMSARIGELEVANEGLPDQLATIQTVADDAKAQAAINAEKLSADVAKAIETAEADIASQGTELENKIASLSQSSSSDRATLKQMLEKSIADGVTSAKSAATSAIAAQASSDASKFSALESAIASATAAVAVNKKTIAENKPTIVGWHQCEQTGSNGADNSGFVAMTCTYTKKRDDTIMMISVNSNQRQINGNSMWRFQVQSANSGGWRECRGPQNQGNGNIYTRYHGCCGVDLHRPMYVGGACHRTDNNQPIKKGRFSARWIQTYVHYDSYWNWESSARMILEERTPQN